MRNHPFPLSKKQFALAFLIAALLLYGSLRFFNSDSWPSTYATAFEKYREQNGDSLTSNRATFLIGVAAGKINAEQLAMEGSQGEEAISDERYWEQQNARYLQSAKDLVASLQWPSSSTAELYSQRNPVVNEWLQTASESVKNDALSSEAMEQLRQAHALHAYRADELRMKALRSEIPWPLYVTAMKEVSAETNFLDQASLSDAQYREIFQSSKEDAIEMNKSLWLPPYRDEALIFFPEIVQNRPDIRSSEDLFQVIDPNKVQSLVSAKKELLYQQLTLQKDLWQGNLSQAEAQIKVAEAQQRFEASRATVLNGSTSNEMELFFGK